MLGLNTRTCRGRIGTSSPVLGFRPIRSFFERTWNDPKDDSPSCSRAEAIARQGVFVNKTAAMYGVGMLANLLRHGSVDYSAVFFNVRSGTAGVLRCDPADWARFGYGVEGAA